MRKNLYFLMAVAAMASVSCIKEDINTDKHLTPSDAVTINAVAENDATLKSSLSDGKVLWHNGDAVSVWNGSAACEFVTADPDGTESAMFVASSSDYQQADSYLALYPHSADALFADGKVNTAVPAVQEAFAGGFAKGVNVAVASGSGESLLFRNVCGYVKFTVPVGMTDLTKVEFAANSPQEYLAANVSVTIADEPSAEVLSEGSASVSLEGTFEAGTSYYIAVLPQTLSKGFTITMTRGEETSTMTTDKPFIISRSKAKPVGELYDGVWQVRLEGSAVPEGQTLKLTQTLENANLFACLETLKTGKLNLKVLYENVYIATEGGAYTDGGETAYTTSDEACDFDIAADGLYRIVLNKQTGKLIIYSPETNPKNKVVIFKRTQAPAADPCTVEITQLWLYGEFNDDGNRPSSNYSLQQSLADPRLFVYKGAALPSKKGRKVKILATNHHNNEYTFGAANTRNVELTIEALGVRTTPLIGGQGNNRYSRFIFPAETNYVEVYIGDESTDTNEHTLNVDQEIAGSYVIFDKRNANEQTSDSSNSADDSSPKL